MTDLAELRRRTAMRAAAQIVALPLLTFGVVGLACGIGLLAYDATAALAALFGVAP